MGPAGNRKWELAHLQTMGLDLIMIKFPPISRSLWLYFMISTSGLKLCHPSNRFGSRGEHSGGYVFAALHLPGMIILAEEASLPGVFWWLSVWMDTGLSTPSTLDGLPSLGELESWRSCFIVVFEVNEASRGWQVDAKGPGVIEASDVAWIFSEQGFFVAGSCRLTPRARVISGSLAVWQTVKPLMLEVGGGGWKSLLAQLASCRA